MDEYPQEDVTLEERYKRYEKIIDKVMNSLARKNLIVSHYFYDVRQELILWVLHKKMPLPSYDPETRKGFNPYNVVYQQGKLIAQNVRTAQVTPNPVRSFAIDTVRTQVLQLTTEEWALIAATRGEKKAFNKFKRFSKIVWGLHKMNQRHFDRITELGPIVSAHALAGGRMHDLKEYGQLNYMLRILTIIINTYWSFEDTDECIGADVYANGLRKRGVQLSREGDSDSRIQYY